MVDGVAVPRKFLPPLPTAPRRGIMTTALSPTMPRRVFHDDCVIALALANRLRYEYVINRMHVFLVIPKTTSFAE